MFHGDVPAWCPTLADVLTDATALAHAFCFADQEGNDALSGLMPASLRVEWAECGRGLLADGSEWQLLVRDLHVESAGDADLSFNLRSEGGGPVWQTHSTDRPQHVDVLRQSGQGAVHVVFGKATRSAAQVVAHLDSGETRPATVVDVPTLDFDVFVASAEWPLWVRSVEAFDEGGASLGRSPDWTPSEHFRAIRDRYAKRRS